MNNLADELERLAKEATPGEWREWFTRRRSPEIYTDGAPAHSPNDLIGSTLRKGDAALIVALRNALPAILSALRREEWQGIETHDGTCFPVLVSRVEPGLHVATTAAFVDVCGTWRVFRSEGGMCELPFSPTHWRPLPPPPTKGTSHE